MKNNKRIKTIPRGAKIRGNNLLNKDLCKKTSLYNLFASKKKSKYCYPNKAKLQRINKNNI